MLHSDSEPEAGRIYPFVIRMKDAYGNGVHGAVNVKITAVEAHCPTPCFFHRREQ